MQLKSWSHSRLDVAEKCLLRAKFQYIDKIPEPDRPLPPGKTEHANDRGTRLHEGAEAYTKGGVELLPELERFRGEHDVLKGMYPSGNVSMEGEWAFTQEWDSVAWMSYDAWCRVKLDVYVTLDDGKAALAVDFKSGKRFGNEVKHQEQMEIYTFTSLLRHPEVQEMTTELWYWDQDELRTQTYTRKQGLALLPKYEARGKRVTAATEFPANPNKFTCRYCPYRKEQSGGNGHCPSAAV